MAKNLFYCANMVCLDRNDFAPSTFQRYLQFAINSYRDDIAFNTATSVEVAYLTPDALGIINMPDDFEYYTKVGLLINNCVVGLTLNPDLNVLTRLDGCGDPITGQCDNCGCAYLTGCDCGCSSCSDVSLQNLDVSSSGNLWWYFASHWRNGQYVGELYGMRGGYNPAGYFKVDWKQRVFQINGVPNVPVVLEYVSNKVSGSTLIDDAAIPVIRYGTHKQLSLFDQSMPDNQRERITREYNKAVSDYKFLKHLPTVEEYLDGLYGDTYSSPKR